MPFGPGFSSPFGDIHHSRMSTTMVLLNWSILTMTVSRELRGYCATTIGTSLIFWLKPSTSNARGEILWRLAFICVIVRSFQNVEMKNPGGLQSRPGLMCLSSASGKILEESAQIASENYPPFSVPPCNQLAAADGVI